MHTEQNKSGLTDGADHGRTLESSPLNPPDAARSALLPKSNLLSVNEGLGRDIRRPPNGGVEAGEPMNSHNNNRRACSIRTLLLLLLALPAVALSVLWLGCASTSPQATIDAQFSYKTNDNAVTITRYIGSGGAASIPDRINGLPVTSIGDRAFDYCTTLTSITIPRSISDIGKGAFQWCYAEIAVDPRNPSYCSVDGILFNKSRTILIRCPGGKVGIYTIPNTITNVASTAFVNCATLTNITIPSSVTSIGDWAFSYCWSLTSITIPSSVTSIQEFLFENCFSLTTVTIGASVTNIGRAAFSDCYRLASITIPNGIASIGQEAFSGCYALTGLYFKGDAPSVGNVVFNGNTNATVYYLPETKGWGATFGGRPTAVWKP